jgi:tetratricopeptide (TPR) repeat protein
MKTLIIIGLTIFFTLGIILFTKSKLEWTNIDTNKVNILKFLWNLKNEYLRINKLTEITKENIWYIYLLENKYYKAKPYYLELYKKNPENELYILKLWYIYYKLKDFNNSKIYYIKYLNLYSVGWNKKLNLKITKRVASLYLKKFEYKKAINIYMKYINKNNNIDWEIYMLLWKSYTNIWEYIKAKDIYMKAINNEDITNNIYKKLWIIYWYLWEYKKSEKYYLKYLEFVPNWYDAYRKLYNLYYKIWNEVKMNNIKRKLLGKDKNKWYIFDNIRYNK